MIPAPGFQNPIPYLFETDSKKLKTSLLVFIAFCKSSVAPILAWIKWSQWTVVGTETFFFPALDVNKLKIDVADMIYDTIAKIYDNTKVDNDFKAFEF